MHIFLVPTSIYNIDFASHPCIIHIYLNSIPLIH